LRGILSPAAIGQLELVRWVAIHSSANKDEPHNASLHLPPDGSDNLRRAAKD